MTVLLIEAGRETLTSGGFALVSRRAAVSLDFFLGLAVCLVWMEMAG